MMIKSNKIVPIRMIKELSYDKKTNEAEWTLKSNDVLELTDEGALGFITKGRYRTMARERNHRVKS